MISSVGILITWIAFLNLLVILFINHLLDYYKIAWLFGAVIGSINNYLGSKYLSFKK